MKIAKMCYGVVKVFKKVSFYYNRNQNVFHLFTYMFL